MATASIGDGDGSLRAKIRENFTNCSICLKDFEDPTILPCLHTYCKRCLASYIPENIPGSKFLCPLCQKETKLPEDGVEGFNHNYFIDSLQNTAQVGHRLQELLLPSGGGDIPQHLSLHLQTNNDVDREVNKGTGLGKIQQNRKDIQGISSRGPPVVTRKAQFRDKPHLVTEFDLNCIYPVSLTTCSKPQLGYLVVDYDNNKVCRFSSDGQLLVEKSKAGNRSLCEPLGIASLPDGTTVVSEYGNNKLTFMSRDLNLTKEVAMEGPDGLYVTNSNTILVAQPNLKQVSIVNIHGATVDTIKHSSFQWPWCVTVLNNGNIVVSDYKAKAVFILSPTGSLLHTYTGSGQHQRCEPNVVCVDQYDNIMIADCYTNKIHIISNDGEFVKFLATKDDGLQIPLGLTINHDGDLAVSQYGGKIKVFRYMDS
ncbi:tripartite motif-containing protein 2-like [Lingula anatina]|uniref:Tripartite motif-containing protein 2-like n=1 Tax=Lingula anatina TaxID=7574 RepID=A0A1S3KFY3_LINAN|nr:tripartite motif-containing protein 2-like [Lingula anatina]|eukprot:XP_013421550.1 tripartite motif-containing protein 2-like [Lingula anatina]